MKLCLFVSIVTISLGAIFQSTINADYVHAGQQMIRGDRLYSDNTRHALILRENGNLELVKNVDKEGKGEVVWESGSANKGVRVAVYQKNGEIILFAESNEPKWAANTAGWRGETLHVTNDCRLVMEDKNRKPVWGVPVFPEEAVKEWKCTVTVKCYFENQYKYTGKGRTKVDAARAAHESADKAEPCESGENSRKEKFEPAKPWKPTTF